MVLQFKSEGHLLAEFLLAQGAARQPSFAGSRRGSQAPGTGPPSRRDAQEEGQLRRRSPRGDRRGCQLTRLLQKWKRSQKRRQERINLPTKKVQTKGKRGAKGKQAEVANQETEEDLPAENGETKNDESPASDEAGEKEAKSNEYHTLGPTVVPVSFLVQSRGMFLSTIL
ncbi:hypothetical protein J1605_019107 [Eschrichtius robustus]|uniref:Non-histone chromosomal protein HMG-14 n=1 Tax=Eschrichtius robustus TaxID=9764 RepID=A0AB34HT45_ESCRO|nr:hypothetical protein J1605_019107 [Eschrichtius robustus]